MNNLVKQINGINLVDNCYLLSSDVLQINTKLTNHVSDQISIFLIEEDGKLFVGDDSNISFEFSLLDNFENKLFEKFKKEIDSTIFLVDEATDEIKMFAGDNVIESILFFAGFVQKNAFPLQKIINIYV